MAIPLGVMVMGLIINRTLTDSALKDFLKGLEFEAAEDDDILEVGPTLATSVAEMFASTRPALKLSLHPSRLVLRKGDSRDIKVVLTVTNLTDRDLSWASTSPSGVSVTKSHSPDSWRIEALSEGAAQITAIASADPNATAGIFVRVL
jgi:hypothetical protein